MVEVCRLARARLEPAEPVWAVGEVDESVNRRERTADGAARSSAGTPSARSTRRSPRCSCAVPTSSAVATLVSFGCHPVTTGSTWTSTRPTTRGRCASSCAR